MFDLGAMIAPYAALFYTDKIDVYRYTPQLQADGSTALVKDTIPYYSAKDCKISFDYETMEKPLDLSDEETNVKLNIKIFCGTGLVLRAGDYAVVSRYKTNGVLVMQYAGKLGLPSVFQSHQEVLLGLERSA